MSTQTNVSKALLALIKAALPTADVLGLSPEAAVPGRISPLGRAVLRIGDPGDPDVDLSPLTYHYQQSFSLELAALETPNVTAFDAVDAMARAVGPAIIADRTLGGLAEFLEAGAAQFDEITADNAVPAMGAVISITASYATTDPLN